MNKILNGTLVTVVLAGAAFGQNVNQSMPRGTLLRQTDSQQQLSDQLRTADKIDFYKRGALLHQQAYQACMEKENKKQTSNPYNCKHELNVVNYYNGMAAAAQSGQTQPQQSQPQFDTTQSTQALRDMLKQPNIPARPLPSTQVGKPLPKMRSNL